MRQPVDYLFPPVEPGVNVPYYRLVLRGCSQLCFQSNELTGLFVVAAALVGSPIAAAYLLVAAVVAPAGRMLLGQRGAVLATGLPGLNPCLIALSLPSFFHTGWTDIGMWVTLVVCVAVTVVLVRVLVAVLPFPILTLPFLIVFWTVYALAPHLSVLRRIPLETFHGTTFHPVGAVLHSLGQALFSTSAWSGLLLLCGLLLSNWRHGVVALLGAVIGTLVSYYYRDVDPTSVNLGLYGFNGVLTAVAVYAMCGAKLRLAILGALVATIMMPAISDIGLQTVCAPLVFTTWLILALGWVERRWFDESPKGNASMPTTPGEPIMFSNLLAQAKALRNSGDWQPFRPGVTAHWLYNEGNGGPSAVLLRYEAGARVPEHEHVGYEHVFVLEGDEFDENGSYPAGSFTVNPPGTRHSPGSTGGCIALLIYEKQVRFVSEQ
ncbi:urea transporter [Mycobacterium sp. CVI_P3]|uniref:Urea transporter n=1 Tax=Mycobacterium pinniadriaticum TaxID=2994102 RepID=A0ABT3SM75_9MYCO|nr:urea transporter [Mycobacterium pinniadriaticum]MCX2934200.1 urea transporter [Mycobacterium pinniadriaticum]MCX2940622.1 urea transporter [Mycobacterium pinniadriaticum]